MSNPGRAGGGGSLLKVGPRRHDGMGVNGSRSMVILDGTNVARAPHGERSATIGHSDIEMNVVGVIDGQAGGIRDRNPDPWILLPSCTRFATEIVIEGS